MTLVGSYYRKCYRIFLEISSFQEIEENRNRMFNLIRYANFKLKMKELQRGLTTNCRYAKKRERVFNLAYLSNNS